MISLFWFQVKGNDVVVPLIYLFIYFLQIFLILIPNIKKTKKTKQCRFSGFDGSSDCTVTEPWIDKKLKVRGLNWQKWKLKDWNEKQWKLEGQFCIFAFYLHFLLSLSLSKLPAHIHSLFIFTTSFCLFPSSFYTTVTPTSCYHLWFVLLSSQACVSCCRSRFIVSFLSKFSFTFFSHLPSSPRFHSQGMKNFQYSHFGPVGMELYSKHWSTSCWRSEKKKGHRSDTRVRRVL